MITVIQHPLPSPDSKEIRDWLNLPAARKFQDYLASLAAKHTADAGNHLIDGEQSSPAEAEKCAVMAREYVAANKIIDEIRSSEHTIQPATLKPMLRKIELTT